MLSSLLKQNMNANISSANRRGTLETLRAGSFIPSSLCSLSSHEIKCFCSHTHVAYEDLQPCFKEKEEESLDRLDEVPWGFRKDVLPSAAAQHLFWCIRGGMVSPVAALSEVWRHHSKLLDYFFCKSTLQSNLGLAFRKVSLKTDMWAKFDPVSRLCDTSESLLL